MKSLTLFERIKQIDPLQAKRYSKLSGESLEIAREGILRHLRACRHLDISPDYTAIREIINDALQGRQIYEDPKSTPKSEMITQYDYKDRYGKYILPIFSMRFSF